jgi:hypothetical protein
MSNTYSLLLIFTAGIVSTRTIRLAILVQVLLAVARLACPNRLTSNWMDCLLQESILHVIG